MERYLLLFILLFPAVSAMFVYFAGRRCRQHSKYMTAGFCLVELAAVMAMMPSVVGQALEVSMPHIMGTGLYLKMDMLRYIFVCMSSFIWLLAGIYSIWYLKSDGKTVRFSIYFLVTLSAVIGVFTSESLLNLFTFFEIMAMTSYVLVIHSEGGKAHEAGKLYLMVSIVTGMTTLMGIFIIYEHTGELNISRLPEAFAGMGGIKYIAMLLVSCSFAAKACVFPLHIWLPTTYSESPSPAGAVFSAVLAKTGVFGIIIIGYIMNWDESFGNVLMALALISMLTGGVLALVQVEVKKILAYSSMSQIGYILLAVAAAGLAGSHPEAAVSAGIYHAVNHAFIKTLLFMAAGIMLFGSDSDNINSMESEAISKTVQLLFLMGILSNMGLAGFCGYIGKTLIHHAIGGIDVSAGIKMTAEYAFLASSALTVAYSLKLYFALFPRRRKTCLKNEESGMVPAYTPMLVLAAVMSLVSMLPASVNHMIEGGAALLFEKPLPAHAHFYTWDSIKSSAGAMLLGVALYRLLVLKYIVKAKDDGAHYPDIAKKWPSLEKNIYLPVFEFQFRLLKSVFSFLDMFITRAAAKVSDGFRNICNIRVKISDGRHESGSMKDSYLNLSEVARRLVLRLESVNYSVFLTASILSFIMFSLVRN